MDASFRGLEFILTVVIFPFAANGIQSSSFRQQPVCTQHVEQLKFMDGVYYGHFHLGDAQNPPQKVLWDTGSNVLVTPAYGRKSAWYTADEKNPKMIMNYYFGDDIVLRNGFDAAKIGGCFFRRVAIGEAVKGYVPRDGAVVGLGPHPSEKVHPYLMGREQRVSFCFPKALDMLGQIIWGATMKQAKGHPSQNSKLRVLGGSAAHHWAVSVDKVALTGIDKWGNTWQRRVAEAARKEQADDSSQYWVAVLDTGASHLILPSEVTADLANYLDDDNLVDCSTAASRMPSLKITLDGHEFTLPPESFLAVPRGNVEALELVLRYPPKLNNTALRSKLSSPSAKCVLLFGRDAPYPGVFVLGMPFLRGKHISYLFDERRIFITPNNGPCEETDNTRSFDSMNHSTQHSFATWDPTSGRNFHGVGGVPW